MRRILAKTDNGTSHNNCGYNMAETKSEWIMVPKDWPVGWRNTKER